MYSIHQISALFRPKSILITDVSAEDTDIGHNIINHLLKSEYTGDIFPVNPAGDPVAGISTYTDITAAPDFADLAVICNCSTHLAALFAQLAKKSVKSVLLMDRLDSSSTDAITRKRLKRLADVYNMVLLGPESLGFTSAVSAVSTIPLTPPPAKGNIAFFSQSSTLCASVLDQAREDSVGLSLLAHIPHGSALNETAMLRYLAADEETAVIIGSIDRIENGKDFIETVQDITYSKPVIMLKSGTDDPRQTTSGLHSGPTSTTVMAYRAAFKQSGAIPVEDMDALFALGRAFSTLPLPKGPATLIISDSHAQTLVGKSSIEQSDLQPVVTNIDGYAVQDGVHELTAKTSAAQALTVLGADENTQAIIIQLSETVAGDKTQPLQELANAAEKLNIPVLIACATSPAIIRPAQSNSLPTFSSLPNAVSALEKMYHYHNWKEQPYPVEISFRRDTSRAQAIIRYAQKAGVTVLPESKARDIARAYELPVPETILVRTSDQAAKAAKRIGYPVALKISSPQIEHKSDIGGVRLDLETPMDVRKAFREITNTALRIRRDDAYIAGCTIQPMAPKDATEVTIRLRKDPQFGPMIIFGMSPAHIDIIGDYACRLAPLTARDAEETVREIRSFTQLKEGGSKAPDLGAIEDILLAVSRMGEELPALQEIEISPILVHNEGAFVADVRMTIGHF